MKKFTFFFIVFLLTKLSLFGQTVSWGPATPAVISENINTCNGDGFIEFEFTNVGIALSDATIEVQLDTGIHYIEGSLIYTSTGSGTIGEDDIDDPRRPIFYIGNFGVGETFTVKIDRSANCEAMDQKINGSEFIDSVHIYESGTEVTYSNGIANGTVAYDILYGSLSITSVVTSPSINNLGGTSTRTMNITNGSFGTINQFYFAEIFNPTDLTISNFRINPSGVNYSIPISNITTSGDSIIIEFLSSELAAIDGSGGTVGDGDNLFEQDETFVLAYDVTPNVCSAGYSISSELNAWFGCSYGNPCQLAENAASIGLTNATPTISLSNALKPRLDFCDTVTYSITLTNNTPETSPAGGAFAKDVTALLGFRYNDDPISTLANNFQWGSGRYNTKFFTNHKLNGFPVTLPTVAGKFATTLPYLPPDYFTSDPDGPGGLTDVDGDGFYDDLPKGATLTISYGVYIIPKDTDCDFGRFDYLGWEHISADISWDNQCDVLMSPIRQEFNYTNHIRDYLNSTFVDAPTDVADGENFSVGIKPHLYTTINCNGGEGTTGADVDWVTQLVLPPGLSLEPGYDATKYILSNDTVTVTAKYSYSWTNFPLQFNCADWDGSNPLAFTISTFYVCSDGTDECYKEEMHCYDFSVVVPHCPIACTGILPLNFSAERVSESWTDNTQTTLVDLDDPGIVKDFVFPFDTVEFNATGVFTDTMTNDLFFRVKYSPENGGNIFLYEEGTIEIIDIDGQYNSGQTNYLIPLTGSPTINNLGGNDYEMIFDLSSYRTTVDPNYSYGQNSGGPPSYDGDSIKIKARIVISNTMAIQNPYKVNGFRGGFFVHDGSNNEIVCDDYGATLNYLEPSFSAGNNEIAQAGCQSIQKPFYITYRSFTDDDHPNEYRPPFHIDSAVIQIPVGWEVGNVKWLDGVVMAASDYDFRADRSLIIRRPSTYKDFDKQNTFYPRFYVELLANCEAPAGKTDFGYTCYLKDYAYLTDVTSHVLKSSTDNIGAVNYTPPTMTVTPINQTVTAYENNVAWEVRVCNSTSNMNVSNNWLLLSDADNQIIIDSVVNITGGSSTLLTTTLTPIGETYAQIGALNQGVCSDFLIYSSFTSCVRDTLDVIHGWSCTGYPLAADVVACGGTTELYILPQNAQISASITPLATTPSDPSNPSGGNFGSSNIDMCADFPAEIKVVNSQPAYLYDVEMSIKVPSLGSGISYVPGSATIEVEGIDAINTPRAIGVAAEAALVLASNNGEVTWDVTLAELDPTNFGSGEGLSGTLNASKNEFILRWEMESTCDLISGDNFFVAISGNDPCGSPALGDGDQGESFPLSINGVTAPYFTFIDIVSSPDKSYVGCDDSKTIDVTLLLAGGSTGTTDTLSVILPDGVGYGGGYVCNTPGKCPTYEGSQIINGEEVLSFKYPNGVTGTIDFSFDLETDTRGVCASSEIVQFLSKKAIPGLPCGTGFCGSSEVITGNEDIIISLEKPILTVALTSLSTTTSSAPFTFDYQLDLTNTGLDTESDVIVEFYCLNPAGTDIEGSAVGRDTLKSILTNGSTTKLTGDFSSYCNPNQGMAVLIVPEYENCYCSAIESMADKSPGLDEIPHDSIPIIDNLLYDLDDDNDGILDTEEHSCEGFRPLDLSAITGNSTNTTITNQPILASVPNAMTFDGDITANHTSTYNSRPQGLANGDLRLGNGTNTETSEYKFVFEEPTTIRLSQAELSGSFELLETWTVTTFGGRITVNNPVVNVVTHNSTNWNDTELNNVIGDGSNQVTFSPKLHNSDGNISVADSEWNLTAEAVTELTIKVVMSNPSANVTRIKVSVDCVPIDTDGDGIADFLDVDSDADGCVDAIEGAGNFKITDLNLNSELDGAVDADGVPVIALGGQATATDVTDAMDESQCPCPTVRMNKHISRRVKRE